MSRLDLASLKIAFQKIVNRHPSLRTNFQIVDGKPVQEVHGYKEVFFKIIDVAGEDVSGLKKKIQETNEIPFNLEEGELFRVYLFRISDENFVMLMSFHHIVTDGKSIGLIFDELCQIYKSEIEKSDQLPMPESKYSDYVKWQNEYLSTIEFNNELEYWKKELSGDLPVLNLFTDKPRPPLQTYNGATVHFTIDSEVIAKLKDISKSEGTTFFTTLLSAYLIFLHRYTQQDEVIAGVPTAGRPRQEFEKVAGYFINPVAIRSDISGNPVYSRYLKAIQKKVLNAISNQNIPFPLLVEKLFQRRDASRAPVFQTFFGLQKIQPLSLQEMIVPGNTGAKINFNEIELEEFDIEQQAGQFDITAEFSEGKKLFAGAFKYNTDLFDRETIEQMVVHFKNLVNDIASNPGKTISELELLTVTEKKVILHERNNTDHTFDEFDCVHKLIEEQVVKNPDAIAVVYENIMWLREPQPSLREPQPPLSNEYKRMTYDELNRRSNQFAHHLKSLGVGKNSLVCLYIERSAEMVIAILGTLKAGAAYVPVDVSYPKDRIEYMISDSKSSVIITQKSLRSNLPETTSKIIVIDEEWDNISKLSVKNPEADTTLDDLAYVIYTSGSTGVPKGVMIEHKSLANHMLWMKNEFDFSSNDSVLQKTPFSFDASVWEFYIPLLIGGKLVMAKPDGHMDTVYIVDTILKNNISIIQLVPTLLRMLLEEKGIENCKSLRYVFSGGEALTVDTKKKLFNKLNVKFYNLYGPTEVTIDSLFYECIKDINEQVIPVGKPVYNTQAYILDKFLNPVPDGVPGELHLGGIDVARGYLNNPDLTNEKFIPNIFTGNQRMYKTGDLIRYNADGNIEYIGRTDKQVKFRGFRIEPGEIEARLKEFSGVKDVVVDMRTDKNGVTKLVGYVVSETDDKNLEQNLKSFLKKKLPEYMIPSSILKIDKLPVTPGGKLDRSSLPDPDSAAVSNEYVKPKSEIEETLSYIWKEILNVERVGVNDNFFGLGGDSILSIQIISKARQHGIKITPKQIFQFQTIAELSNEADLSEKINIDQGVVTGEIELTPIQKWFFEKNFNNPNHYNHSVLLSVPGNLDEKILASALREVIQHHDALRIRFTKNDTGWKQFYSDTIDSIPFASEIISGNSLTDFNQNLETRINELQQSLNLAEGPLISVGYFKSDHIEENRLLIIIHHLIVDGISWRILLEDFYDAYKQFESTVKINLNSKTNSFKDWSNELTNYASKKTVLDEIDYWSSIGNRKIAKLPKDYSADSSKNTVDNESTIFSELNEEDTMQLLHDVSKTYNTQVNDILLSALSMAIHEWTDEREFLIDLEGHGREDISDSVDVSRTVGWFTTIYPFQLTLSDKNNIGDTIKHIKESLRQIPQNGIGYGLIKYNSPGKISKNEIASFPESEIVFNYLGQINESISSDSNWKIGSKTLVLSQPLNSRRNYLIEINGMIINQKLKLEFNYCSEIHNRETMQNFANSYMKSLKEIIKHCMSGEERGYTPSDFSAAGLNQQDLDNLIANLNR